MKIQSSDNSAEVVLIVGCSGFLGSHLAQECARRGAQLLGVDRVLPQDPSLWAGFAQGSADTTDYRSLIGGKKLAACFYLSGLASVAGSLAEPFRDYTALVPGVACLLDYLQAQHPSTHFVLYSSAAVYGQPRELPIREEFRPAPLTPYGVHRQIAEELLMHYAQIYGMTSSVLRLFSAYGIYNRKMLFWDLLEKWRTAARDGGRVIAAHGSGNETRDFIHGRDVARAALVVRDHPPVAGRAQIVNVASGCEVRIRDASDLLLRELPHPVRMEFSGEVKRGDPLNRVADVSKLKAMGYEPLYSLENGLREYGQWFIQTKEKEVQ